MPLDALGVLGDIRDPAQYIVDDTAGKTFAEFERDRRTRQLVERNFEIIGAAGQSIAEPCSPHRGANHLPRRDRRLSNALIHGYDTIDYETVWRAVQDALPVLRAEVDRLLGEYRITS